MYMYIYIDLAVPLIAMAAAVQGSRSAMVNSD